MEKYRVIDTMRTDDMEVFSGTVEELKEYIKWYFQEEEEKPEGYNEALEAKTFGEVMDCIQWHNLYIFGDAAKIEIEEIRG